MADFTSRNGMVWVQVLGPNTAVDPLLCAGAEDITEPLQSKELLYCWKPDGTGWNVTGKLISPPGPVTFSLQTRLTPNLSKIEDLPFPCSIYFTERTDGLADVFTNYDRAFVLMECESAELVYAGVKSISEDAETMVTVSFEGSPPILKIVKLVIDRKVTAMTEGYNGLALNLDQHPYNDSGDTLLPGDVGIIVGNSAVAPAFADIEFTADAFNAFAATAADPFAAGEDAAAAVNFYIDRNVRRYLVAMTAPGAAQGMVAYSDDLGVTWVVVNIGGAAAGDGAVYGEGLFALDMYHIWLAGANGYIYFSEDGGETWAEQEAGVIAATDYSSIHFASPSYGIVGGPADVIALSDDGGVTWAAAAATGSGGDILTAVRLDKNRLWVGTDDGELWYSRDAGATWTQRTGWQGSGVGEVRSLSFYGDHVAYMASDTAAPLGSVLFTFNGGFTWEVLDTPPNSGLNHVKAVSERMAIACGEPHGGLSFIAKVRAT